MSKQPDFDQIASLLVHAEVCFKDHVRDLERDNANGNLTKFVERWQARAASVAEQRALLNQWIADRHGHALHAGVAS